MENIKNANENQEQIVIMFRNRNNQIFQMIMKQLQQNYLEKL